MLAELAAANAAFAVIKQTVQNGKDLSSVAHAIGEFIGAKDDLYKNGHKKKNSFWASFKGESHNDLEEFMALEKIKEQEKQLKELMMFYGRHHLWDDWIKFQVEARKKRQELKKIADKKRKALINSVLLILLIMVLFGGVSLLIWLALYLRGI